MKIITENEKICIFPEDGEERTLLERKVRNLNIKTFYAEIPENLIEGDNSILNHVEL